MSGKKSALGFGFQPDQSQHHFLVTIPRPADGTVFFYERFKWQEDTDHQILDELLDKAKAMISKHKWKLIEEAVKTEFNRRLKKEGIAAGKWKTGQVPVERLLGKELLLLVWAIEDSDPSVIPTAIRNWLGLSPEERWWLFTMTNASTGNLHDKRGWRKAIRYALTENPVEENRKQMDLFEFLFEQQKEE
ncbi:DUF3780 domain-containing protein [Paenibacillus sediminis]|uniref:DUF3780 domain-containing protein n=1 Tax=Paenibacillus sediminis TaxID=664909 RepID=A0ABS4H6R2_9BACL|nr:DUF3780 domain-containing protein [Paenibacillus sediminis]MBP1938221.1 hypothetical protein [Paenibacillus sediminis]